MIYPVDSAIHLSNKWGQIFANNNLKITVDANKKVVNFLDVTLDLNTGKFKLYSKPSTTPLYVHSQSNHPPNILRNIPVAINRRLSSVSSDHEVFNEASAPYQEALRKSGYAFKLEFNKPPQQPPSQKRKRQRNVASHGNTEQAQRTCLYMQTSTQVHSKVQSDM